MWTERPRPVRPTERGLLTVVALSLAVSVAAQDAEEKQPKSYRIYGQLTTEFELNQADDRDDYTKFKQIASFNIEWSKITIGVQAQFIDYSDPELVDRLDLDRLLEGFELRRYYIDYQGDHVSGRLGTFFSSFGRGLSLYVQKNDALGLDEPFHGGLTKIRLKHFDVTVLGGRVTEPQLQAQYEREFDDELYGGRVLARLPFNTYFGGSAVSAKLDRFFPVGTDEVDLWSIEAGGTSLFGVLDIAGEWSEIDKTEGPREKEGYGRYFSAVAYIGPVSVLAEYKDYYNFAYRYNEPPSAGRADENYEHNDVKGPRLMVTADIFSIGSILHASYGDFDTHKTTTSPGGLNGDRNVEWYAGLEQTIGSFYFQGSYFDRDWKIREITETHTLADLHLSVGRRGEIILGYDQRFEESAYFSLDTTRTTLAYSRSPWGTVSLRYAFEEKNSSEKDDFWGVEIQYLPKPTLILTVFAGGDPGGLVCAGGQCRQEPRFEGYRLNLTWRF